MEEAAIRSAACCVRPAMRGVSAIWSKSSKASIVGFTCDQRCSSLFGIVSEHHHLRQVSDAFDIVGWQ